MANKQAEHLTFSVNEAFNLLAANKVIETWDAGLVFTTANSWEGTHFGFGVFLATVIFTLYHDTFLA